MHWVRDNTSTSSVYSLQERSARGTPVRGNPRNTTLRYDLSPVLRPIQNGELVDRHRRCGKKYLDTFSASIKNPRSSMPMCTWVPKMSNRCASSPMSLRTPR